MHSLTSHSEISEALPTPSRFGESREPGSSATLVAVRSEKERQAHRVGFGMFLQSSVRRGSSVRQDVRRDVRREIHGHSLFQPRSSFGKAKKNTNDYTIVWTKLSTPLTGHFTPLRFMSDLGHPWLRPPFGWLRLRFVLGSAAGRDGQPLPPAPCQVAFGGNRVGGPHVLNKK